MDTNALLGVWTGTIHDDDNNWDARITLSILQPAKVGDMLGVFDIPFLPCAGTLRVTAVDDDIIELQAEKLQGECAEAESYRLELLSDGGLLYRWQTEEGEAFCLLERALEE